MLSVAAVPSVVAAVLSVAAVSSVAAVPLVAAAIVSPFVPTDFQISFCTRMEKTLLL